MGRPTIDTLAAMRQPLCPLDRRSFMQLALAGAAGLALSGCGTQDEEPLPTSFRIGGMGPTTGDAKALGMPARFGAQIAVEELTEAERIAVELDFIDDAGSPSKARERYFGLKDWGLQMLMGPITPSCAAEIMADTCAERVFALVTSAGTPALVGGQTPDTGRRDNVFRLCLSDVALGEQAARLACEQALGTRFAVVFNDHDDYATSLHDAFVTEVHLQGGEAVSCAFQDGEGLDVAEALQQAHDAEADLVFLPVRQKAALAALREARAMEYAPHFLCVDDVVGIGAALAAGSASNDLTEGLLLVTSFIPAADDERTQAFCEAFKTKAILEKYARQMATQTAAQAYDGVYALVGALEQAGLAPSATPAEVTDALAAIFAGGYTYEGLTCPPDSSMSWSEDGEVTKQAMLAQVRAGTPGPLEGSGTDV